MHEFHKRLPPLDLLVAFEAAARYASFTQAAKELNVTQSAVSQRVRNLERRLGMALFERAHRSVRLTAQGREFYNSVSFALMHLLSAADRLRADEGARKLVVATDTSVAEMWLGSRLHRFQAAHPDVVLHLTASDVLEDCFADAVELAIIHGDGSWPGYDSVPLFQEEVFPVCAPSFLKKSAKLSEPKDLAQAVLLDLEYEHWKWMNWSIWLTEMGVHTPVRQQTLRSNSYALLIEAARRGQGVALGWRRFVDDDLGEGRLVAPIRASVKTGLAYYLVKRANRAPSPQIDAFETWLASEFETQALYPL
jgi:DNA-binding transcriptional LysR family regulator